MLAEQWRDEGGCYPGALPSQTSTPERSEPDAGSVVSGVLGIIGFGALFGFGAAAGMSLWSGSGSGSDYDDI